jgi:esterase/lipase
VPILVAHGALDRTASPRDADAILAAVSSTVRERFAGPRSGHVVPVDVDGPDLAAAVADFLGRRSAAPAGLTSPRGPS